MDALEFAKQRRRMCKNVGSCTGCELHGKWCKLGHIDNTIEDDERTIKVVEKWAKEHPEKTRQSAFLKMFPDAPRDDEDLLAVCPKNTIKGFVCGYRKTCADCRREFWLAPLEDEG